MTAHIAREQQLRFTHLACQTCQAKIHCERCGEDTAQALLQLDGVVSAQVDMTTQTMCITGSIPTHTLEEKLEDLGFWIE